MRFYGRRVGMWGRAAAEGGGLKEVVEVVVYTGRDEPAGLVD